MLCCHDVAVWAGVVLLSPLHRRHQCWPTHHPPPKQLLRWLEVGGMSLGLLGIVGVVGHHWALLALLVLLLAGGGVLCHCDVAA